MAVWLVVVVIAAAWTLGGYPLVEPDEGRNAEVVREMAAGGDFVLPHLNGLPYLDKPVAFFALCATSVELLGVNEFAVRLPSLVFTFATLLVAGWFGARVMDKEAGVMVMLATVTAPLVTAFSRIVIMDAVLSFFVVLAIVAFREAVEIRRLDAAGGWLRWTLLAWTAVGLGVLTKGPVAIAVPLLVVTPYAVWRRSAWAVWHPLGLAAAVAIVAPWLMAVSHEVPGFLRYVVLTETVARVASDELRRSEPIWFFLPVMLVGTFPWWVPAAAALLPGRGAKSRIQKPDRVLLVLWLVLPLLLFSLSRGKQEQYVLPLVPAVALLAVVGVLERPRCVRFAAVLWAVFGAVLVVAAMWVAPHLDTARIPPEAAARAGALLGFAAFIGAVLAGFAPISRRYLAVIGLGLPVAVLPVVAAPAIKAAANHRSARDLATAIEQHSDPGIELLWVESFAAGLSFYLERVIPLASVDGDELRSNYVVRFPERFMSDMGSLRPLPDLQALVQCAHPRVLLISARRVDLRAVIEAGGEPVLWEGRRWAAFGPRCTTMDQSEGNGRVPPGSEVLPFNAVPRPVGNSGSVSRQAH